MASISTFKVELVCMARARAIAVTQALALQDTRLSVQILAIKSLCPFQFP